MRRGPGLAPAHIQIGTLPYFLLRVAAPRKAEAPLPSSRRASLGGEPHSLVQGGEIGQVQGNSLQAGFGAAQLGPRMAPEARTDAQPTAGEFIARETLCEQISVGHIGQPSIDGVHCARPDSGVEGRLSFQIQPSSHSASFLVPSTGTTAMGRGKRTSPVCRANVRS